MIIQNKGLSIGKYFIPPFTLERGELIVINLSGGAHYQDLKMELVDIFTGKKRNENVLISQTLTFVDHFKETKLRQLFNPTTVEKYIKQNANPTNSLAKKIYDIEQISGKTKIKLLNRNQLKLISVYSVLSKTSDIIFDLDGQDPQGAEETYKIIKDYIKNMGCAILLDWTLDMKNQCSKFIAVEH